jgi:hypothetical protein
MNLYQESRAIAFEAWQESQGDFDQASEFIWGSCDGHEVAIYFHTAIEFCAANDTSDGEAWLEDCGGIAQPGDSFGQIVCRIAFATLYCACMERLNEIEMESEE